MTTDEIMRLANAYATELHFGSNSAAYAYSHLSEAIEALMADAARYKWIKEHCVLGIYQNGNGWDMGIDGVAPDSKRDIDSAVDAAMREST